MIKINIIMNTSMEEILAFKCCTLPGQNLEVQIKNTSTRPVTIRNYFILKNDTEVLKVEYVYPPWHQKVAPNDICAFYCSMDETVWRNYNVLELTDKDGNTFSESYQSS
jgi:hypothetical protein